MLLIYIVILVTYIYISYLLFIVVIPYTSGESTLRRQPQDIYSGDNVIISDLWLMLVNSVKSKPSLLTSSFKVIYLSVSLFFILTALIIACSFILPHSK